ncbi:MAG: hypothetical protein ABIC40_05300 [bacterium]
MDIREERLKSIEAAETLHSTLGVATGFAAALALIGAWAATKFEPSTAIPIALAIAAMWATICRCVSDFSRGNIFRIDSAVIIFILAATISPAPEVIISGVIAGLAIYYVVVLAIFSSPKIELGGGDRLYYFRHPLDRIIPMPYLAPEPLTGIFEPTLTMYRESGLLGIPMPKFSAFDPLSVHKFIRSRALHFLAFRTDWDHKITRHRMAIGLLNLLDTIHTMETSNLEGVALAAGARLAINDYPAFARDHLMMTLSSFAPGKRDRILSAFDLNPT